MSPPSSLVRRLCVGLGLCGLALPVVARAQPAVDAEDACAGKQAGDACRRVTLVKPADGGELERSAAPGTCRADECCDLDYSAGSPPRTTCRDCLVCAEGPPSTLPAPSVGDPAGPSAEVEPPRASADEPPAHPPGEKPGCRLGGGAPPPGQDAPWWMVGGALGLLAARPRR